tara:strand:+ start:22708 stop:22977 length:270 start_codon:yes stop_codon:yes gene_type:complete
MSTIQKNPYITASCHWRAKTINLLVPQPTFSEKIKAKGSNSIPKNQKTNYASLAILSYSFSLHFFDRIVQEWQKPDCRQKTECNSYHGR